MQLGSALLITEKLKPMDGGGPSVASKHGKRRCPSSEEDREKGQNEDCQRNRKKKRDRSLRLQNIEKQRNDFFEKFKISSVEHLQAEFRRYQQKEKKLKTLCEKLGVTEDGLEAEFRRLQKTEIEHNALCEKLGVAQEGLQMPIDDDFIQLDDLLSNTFGSSFDGPLPTIGGAKAVMNESLDQYKFASFFDNQASVLGRKEGSMNEPPVQCEEIGSLGSKSHTIFNT